jgi:hypothetical protein
MRQELTMTTVDNLTELEQVEGGDLGITPQCFGGIGLGVLTGLSLGGPVLGVALGFVGGLAGGCFAPTPAS